MGKSSLNKDILKKLIVVFSSLFGIGFLPILGGTCASLVAILFFLLFKNSFHFFIFSSIIVISSFPLSTYAEKIFKEKDSSKIVIDDFSGMLVSLLFLPKKGVFIFLAFILFRMFDFLKVYPANLWEKLEGGKGIVGDDLIAGFYTNVILQFLRVILKISL